MFVLATEQLLVSGLVDELAVAHWVFSEATMAAPERSAPFSLKISCR
jgi:hypothetical protein